MTLSMYDLCPDTTGPYQPFAGDLMIKFRLDQWPDEDILATAADLVPGSRQTAPLGDLDQGLVTTEARFAGTFMPITSALASPNGGCGPSGGPFVACRTTQGFSRPHAKPNAGAQAWIFEQIFAGLGQSAGQPVAVCPDGDSGRQPAGPARGLRRHCFQRRRRADHTQHRWDFGDGTVKVGSTPSHTFSTPGTYDVRLTVTDNTGRTDTLSRRLRVGPPNQPPQGVMQHAPEGRVGQSLAFDGSGSSDPDGSIERHFWNFGDGTFAEGASATHAYARPGTYIVGLNVTDDEDDVPDLVPARGDHRALVAGVAHAQRPHRLRGQPAAGVLLDRPRLGHALRAAGAQHGQRGAVARRARARRPRSFQPEVDLPANGSLRWRVRACNAMGCGAWSAEQAFATITCSGPPAPTPVAPQGCLITAQPTLSWTAVAGASAYDLTLERVFDGLLILESDVSSATSFQVPSSLSAYTEYRFRVRALGGAWSTYRYFMTHCLPELAGTASPSRPPTPPTEPCRCSNGRPPPTRTTTRSR